MIYTTPEPTTTYDSRTITHNQECPAFSVAIVEQGTSGISVPVHPGQVPYTLPHGTIEFRDKTTHAVLASMSTASGSKLTVDVAACEMVITPLSLVDLVGPGTIKVLVKWVTGSVPGGWGTAFSVVGVKPTYLTPTERNLRMLERQRGS